MSKGLRLPARVKVQRTPFTKGSAANNPIAVTDPRRCRSCRDSPCTRYCPTHHLVRLPGRPPAAIGGCVECAACPLFCDNLVFRYPPGGVGVVHEYG